MKAFLSAWASGEAEAAAACFAVHGIYALHLSADVVQHGGEAVGRDDIAEALRRFRSSFDQLVYRPVHLRFNEHIVRTQVEFRYRHRASGETLSGRLRLVFQVHDGQIMRADEYHDRAKVEAFIRLFAHLPRR